SCAAPDGRPERGSRPRALALPAQSASHAHHDRGDRYRWIGGPSITTGTPVTSETRCRFQPRSTRSALHAGRESLVGEVGRQPLLDVLLRHAPPLRVRLHLVLAEAAD